MNFKIPEIFQQVWFSVSFINDPSKWNLEVIDYINLTLVKRRKHFQKEILGVAF